MRENLVWLLLPVAVVVTLRVALPTMVSRYVNHGLARKLPIFPTVVIKTTWNSDE